LGLTPADVVLIPLSISYHFIASALSCLKAGATILDGAEQSVPEMLQCGAKQGVSILYASPLQYELISRAEGSCALPTLRRAISTSALLPKRIADLFFERLQVRLTQVYGIIEVGLPLWNEIQSVEPSALGVCKPPYEAKIVDEDGAVVEAGEVGELAVRGPGLFSGYLVGPSTGSSHTLDQCLLQEGWFLTGDLVVQNDVGIVFYHGRKKSVINCGGNKIFPEEVEDVLRSVPAISAVRVSAEPHPLLGSLVIAEIVVVPNQHVSFDALRALCYRELSGYKVPKEFRIVESLPNTASGKVIRHSGEEIVRSV
jgi:acyl-coenzyme A synthetase/AMP-(fatty) acid ligase